MKKTGIITIGILSSTAVLATLFLLLGLFGVFTPIMTTNDKTASAAVVGAGEHWDLANNKLYIANQADLNSFRTAVNGGNKFSGKTVYLTASFTITGTWSTIGTHVSSNSKSFEGIFDGQGFAISGESDTSGFYTTGSSNIGFFGYTTAAIVKNLTLNKIRFTGNEVGIITSYAPDIKIINCKINDAILNGTNVGGLVGYSYLNQVTVNDCTITDLTASGDKVGGILGYGYLGKINATNFTINGNVNMIATDGKIGGIVGDTNTSVIAESCKIISETGTIEGESVGGFVGLSSSSITITNSSVKLSKLSSDKNTGGLIGFTSSNFTIDNCKINIKNILGTVSNTSASYYVGGVVGYGLGTIRNCIVKADYVSNTFSSYSSSSATITIYVGGIIGYSANNITIDHCIVMSIISANSTNNTSYVGGIIGSYNTSYTATINDCFI